MPRESFRFSHRQSVGLVFLCTLFGVAAQYFIKSSGMQMAQITLASLLTNWHLWAGLSLYGVSTGLLILALRDGELSLLYPVISLTYVWVTVLSVLVFHEKLTGPKVAGIATICCGVALLGKGRSQ
ncbi:MAG: EamA family transporter [Bryobacteraceae bacterium]|nr:EamA family transporter [Bryobacteraceae bacterium]MCX7605375.1 EamA family transporter [Bryobacteraceae bacterium]